MYSRMYSGDFGLNNYAWLLPFLLLDVVLRGISLWKSARKGENWWFIALLLINSIGILPAIYLFTHRESVKPSKKKK